MRKHFEDWFKVRANLPVNEGPMDWLAAGAAKMGFPGWQKDRQRAQQDPRNTANMPVNYDALANNPQWHSNLDNFNRFKYRYSKQCKITHNHTSN
jgi:hypothetical protein